MFVLFLVSIAFDCPNRSRRCEYLRTPLPHQKGKTHKIHSRVSHSAIIGIRINACTFFSISKIAWTHSTCYACNIPLESFDLLLRHFIGAHICEFGFIWPQMTSVCSAPQPWHQRPIQAPLNIYFIAPHRSYENGKFGNTPSLQRLLRIARTRTFASLL